MSIYTPYFQIPKNIYFNLHEEYNCNNLKLDVNYKIILDISEECCICLEDIQYGIQLGCKHNICRNCVSDLNLQMQFENCPYCRQTINKSNIELFKTKSQDDYEKKSDEIKKQLIIAHEKQSKIDKINTAISYIQHIDAKYTNKPIYEQPFALFPELHKPTLQQQSTLRQLNIDKEMNKKAWKAKKRK